MVLTAVGSGTDMLSLYVIHQVCAPCAFQVEEPAHKLRTNRRCSSECSVFLLINTDSFRDEIMQWQRSRSINHNLTDCKTADTGLVLCIASYAHFTPELSLVLIINRSWRDSTLTWR